MKKALLTAMATALIAGSVSTAQAKKVEDLGLDITGIGQLGHTFVQTGNDQQGINRLRLKIAATPAEKLSFNSSFELGPNQNFGAQNAAAAADSRVVDAYVTLTYLPWITVKAGQMPTPVSYELGADEYSLETINYSQFIGNLVNRDRGLGGIIPITENVKVVAWILNGNGTVGGASADDEDKANYGAMLTADPVKDLNVKIWGNTGKEIASKNTAVGLGVDYKISGWHLSAEYGQNSNKAAAATTKNRDWYVHGSYLIPETALQLVARYDRYDPNTTVSNNENKITTVGVNWNFEKDARLQIMQEMKSETPSVKNNQTQIQLSVRF